MAGTVITLMAGGLAYAFSNFAQKSDVESRLGRIENKLDCLIDRKMCR